ncbi:hypothetical protein MATL_G00105090 [Megalops atlanticus]|uniref:MHC class I-like antigen recognition-like domain-containing protein n=1 Tax=Megalops atlanticus TaxID=7932 RepID=A0A9D3Q469_MEGAT|nr:hypothetical protein MATL_G00105090 [Megalops atlanticus]
MNGMCSPTFLLLLRVATVYTGSHSLWVLATFIHGQTQFPEFCAVLMLDDVQVQYYDNINKVVSQRQQSSGDEENDARLDHLSIMADLYHSMKRRSQLLKLRFNYTEGVHVYQRMSGCELNDGNPSPIMEWSAFDGTETARYYKLNYSLNPLWPELMWSELKFAAYTYIYQPFCIKTLKQHLMKEKNVLMRKERPRVRLIQKTDRDTGGVTVSCLATGFYPRHINLTMLRDVLVLAVVLSPFITAFIIYKRRHRGSQTSLQPVYTEAQRTEDSTTTSHST